MEAAWVAIIATAVLTILQVLNAWGLALWTNKKAEERERQKQGEPKRAALPKRKNSDVFPVKAGLLLCGIQFAVSVAGVLLANRNPNSNVNTQMLLIALYFAGGLFALGSFGFVSMVYMIERHLDSYARFVEMYFTVGKGQMDIQGRMAGSLEQVAQSQQDVFAVVRELVIEVTRLGGNPRLKDLWRKNSGQG